MIAAGRLPLRSDPANNQFESPSAHGPAAAQMSEFTLYLGIPQEILRLAKRKVRH
jgi:hypothetical protein